MRRLARHLFTLCSAVSLVLCVAICVLWVRSFRSPDLIVYARRDVPTGDRVAYVLLFQCGVTDVYQTVVPSPRPADYGPADYGFDWYNLAYARRANAGWLGFSCYAANTRTGRRSGMSLPIGALLLLSNVLPAGYILSVAYRRRWARRVTAGLCPSCGYDLRASPERCPECGATAISTANG